MKKEKMCLIKKGVLLLVCVFDDGEFPGICSKVSNNPGR